MSAPARPPSARALTPGEIADLLDALPAVIAAEGRGAPPAGRGWHRAPGEWCAHEVVGHLIEAEGRGSVLR